MGLQSCRLINISLQSLARNGPSINCPSVHLKTPVLSLLLLQRLQGRGHLLLCQSLLLLLLHRLYGRGLLLLLLLRHQDRGLLFLLRLLLRQLRKEPGAAADVAPAGTRPVATGADAALHSGSRPAADAALHSLLPCPSFPAPPSASPRPGSELFTLSSFPAAPKATSGSARCSPLPPSVWSPADRQLQPSAAP